MTRTLLVIACVILTQKVHGSWYGNIIARDLGYRGLSTITNYIFHPEQLSWNEARQVCENNGGTLAKIETLALHQLIYDVAMDTHHTNIFAGYDYYLAITRTEDGDYLWTSDCTLLEEVGIYDLGKTDQSCVNVKKDSLAAEDHSCEHRRAFLCQQDTSLPCGENVMLNGSFQYYPNTNSSVCSELCKKDVHCWSSIRYPVDMCVLVMLSGYGNDGLQMVAKQCIMVTLNETIAVNYLVDISKFASFSCVPPYNPIAPSATDSPSSSVYHSPFPCYTEPQTVIQPTTVRVPTTVIQPTTVTVPTTVVQPTTVTVPTTVVQPTTVTVPTTVVQPTTVEVLTTVVQPTTVAVLTTAVQPTTVEVLTIVVQPTTVEVLTTVVQPTTVTVPTLVVQPSTVREPTTVIQPTTVTELTTVEMPTTVIVPSTVTLPATFTDISTYIQTVTQTLTFDTTYNLTTEQITEIESKAAELARNLTVNTRSTSSYTRRLTSAEDKRFSASFVGYTGIVFVVVPLGLILLLDLRKLVSDFRNSFNMNS